MIVPLLLLLVAAVHTGFSYRFIEKDCGGRYKILMRSGIHTIHFIPDSTGDSVLLWKHNATPAITDSRRRVSGIYFVISGLLKRDSGRYIAREKNGEVVLEEVLLVSESSKSMTLQKSEELRFSFPLENQYCYIYFIPDLDSYRTRYLLVRGGVYLETASECEWLSFTQPCGLEKAHMGSKCVGKFEIRDDDGDLVHVVHVEMEEEPSDLSHVGTALGIFFLSSGCCFCLKLCCCRKKSKKRQTTDVNGDDSPAEGHSQYDTEPVRRTPVQVNQPTHPATHNPPQPSHAPTGLPTNMPTVLMPPAYSEVLAPAGPPDAPPPYSDFEPRFELQGFASAPPLGSESGHSDVYTSDKLNFL